MEFEEMKKIWDTQNDHPLYAIDENTLLVRILRKKSKAARWAGINEWGLILINLALIAVISFGLLESSTTFYRIAIPVALTFGLLYVVYLRTQRKKQSEAFDRSLLGELNHAIANRSYLERMSRSMVWWYIVPLAAPLLLNMFFIEDHTKLYWKVAIVTCALILSSLLTQWESKRLHAPKRRELERLREMLMSNK